ncbi:MAG: DUF1028 domain-containing protein [Candidatus Eisenbacteria bacterium]|jgi:uncharacterized Ntn-hydrolase superfamily protein|nr:DUF1028 domain-containing protein [Candidatus Eisenbacteria bacterium]
MHKTTQLPRRPTLHGEVVSFVAAFGLTALIVPSTSAICSEPIATFSIVAFDSVTGDLGVAVQSKFFAVGSVVPWARAGVGAVASQAFGNPTYGPLGLDLLSQGTEVHEAIRRLLADDPQREQRQLGIVDAAGYSAAFTGSECLPWAGHFVGRHFSVQGNILVSGTTVEAMAHAFQGTDDMLGERLMRALEAGQEAGGDSRGMQSAAIVIVRNGGGYGGYTDRYCDLRVDDHENPIAELRRIFNIWKVQALINEGYSLADAGKVEASITVGLKAVELDSLSGEAHYHLACYYAKATRFDEALRTLEQAILRDASYARRAPDDPDFAPIKTDPRFVVLTAPPEE